MTTNDLINASFEARRSGNIDEACRLMGEAMKRRDANRVLAARYTMKPRHKATYKKTFVAG